MKNFVFRLGLLGFLSLQNDDIPGNAAMYDVVNALEWTNKYIQYFGGDPNSITIAGQVWKNCNKFTKYL